MDLILIVCTYIILLKTSMIGTCHATIDVLLSTNSESMNQRFFTIFFLFSFKIRQNSSIEIKKNISDYSFLQKKTHFTAPLKENKNFFAKKIRAKKFVDSKFVKICHKQVK